MSEKLKREKKKIIISENRNFDGIWIPKKLYITNKLSPRTKFFVVEILISTQNIHKLNMLCNI